MRIGLCCAASKNNSATLVTSLLWNRSSLKNLNYHGVDDQNDYILCILNECMAIIGHRTNHICHNFILK